MTARETLDAMKAHGHSAGCAAHDDCLRANTASIAAAIEAVLALHPRTCEMSGQRCLDNECPLLMCGPCGDSWPCPTVAAIENALAP